MFDSLRKRYALAGKDTSGKLKRRAVVTAQQLRAEAALLIEWLRLSLRHGWIGSWANRNTNGPRPVDEKGRTERILATRRKRALRFPYGKNGVRLGLCKPPPDEDPAPVAPAPSASGSKPSSPEAQPWAVRCLRSRSSVGASCRRRTSMPIPGRYGRNRLLAAPSTQFVELGVVLPSMERAGIEPATSGLQSRRSPS